MKLKTLKKGDTIGVISPASACTEDEILNGVKYFKSLGFKIKLGKHIFTKTKYLAGDDKSRLDDLQDMFLDPNVSCILCIRGGYGTMRILDKIDFNVIKNNPKLFCGYSDITALLNSINKLGDFITFHSPMLTSQFDKTTLDSFLNIIMNGKKGVKICNPTDIPYSSFNDSIIEGKLVGGNLSLISSTLGTPYEINTKDSILFIEDVHEEPYAIDRMLTQLHLSGKLNECKGFILGNFKGCEAKDLNKSFTLYEVFKDRLISLNKPTLLNLCCGHDNPKLTLPIGAKIKLNTSKGEIELLEDIFK